MSFSKEVKEEIAGRFGEARHCILAELAAVLSICASVKKQKDGQIFLVFITENEIVARKCFTLLKKAFNIDTDVLEENGKIVLTDTKQVEEICLALKFSVAEDGSLMSSQILTLNTCCKRAFIRGAFLAAGSISDPEKGYHLEIVFQDTAKADQLIDMMRFFQIEAKKVNRKKYEVVYIKEGSQIVDLLNVMEAHHSLMELENVRILKDVRNFVNRQVNCEAANINKTVNAAAKQVDDIRYIQKTVGFQNISENLVEIAELRIRYPEASLKELGEMLSAPIGKSGVNHRLKKLSSIAEALRDKEEMS